ncbi:hypothetical protein EJ08DRAFT_592531 [Tothia fuscella]|uniref:Uncharacterized protein n=1 Tax=Tothia fuscella TaxID=1048955 RepID=A0A9P4NMT7_9PEZI|nr:hypothetical protein EJ08DRAFT_592531 [Tothia fuscella]
MTGIAAGQAPTLTEVRQGAYIPEHAERRQQFETVDSPRLPSASGNVTRPSPGAPRPTNTTDDNNLERIKTADENTEESFKPNPLISHPTVYDLNRSNSGTFPNGYKFPPKHTWKEATSIGFRAFLNFTFRSWLGFAIVFYAVQIVGWGGMIFLLLCTAGDPRMCWLEKPKGSGNWVTDCSDKHTSKSLWIEIDAQVLTALFCVTAFGLAPWRCRDFWHLMQYRIWHEHLALRKLAAAHKGWFRLPGSQHLDPSVKGADCVDHPMDSEILKLLPHPVDKSATPPLTGVRALPTKIWKMDFVVWMMLGNTIFQIILCGFMWGQNRYVRPAWATALFIVLGMLSGIFAGWVQFQESKKIKQREGIPLTKAKTDGNLELEGREKV